MTSEHILSLAVCCLPSVCSGRAEKNTHLPSPLKNQNFQVQSFCGPTSSEYSRGTPFRYRSGQLEHCTLYGVRSEHTDWQNLFPCPPFCPLTPVSPSSIFTLP